MVPFVYYKSFLQLLQAEAEPKISSSDDRVDFHFFCMDIVMEFCEQVGENVAGALWLEPNHLIEIDLAKRLSVRCPPARANLQVLHKNLWIYFLEHLSSMLPVGDRLQLTTNEKFVSVEHRVVANAEGPRISVPCFFTTHFTPNSRLYGPMDELPSTEFMKHFNTNGFNGTSALLHFRI